MTLVFFVLNTAVMFVMLAVILAPVGLVIRAVKRRVEKKPEFVMMPDIEYKVNVRAARKYLKSRGIVVA